MNGIVQEENRLQGSGGYEIGQETSAPLGNIREGKRTSPGQIVVERISMQTEFDDEREYAHWGLNE